MSEETRTLKGLGIVAIGMGLCLVFFFSDSTKPQPATVAKAAHPRAIVAAMASDPRVTDDTVMMVGDIRLINLTGFYAWDGSRSNDWRKDWDESDPSKELKPGEKVKLLRKKWATHIQTGHTPEQVPYWQIRSIDRPKRPAEWVPEFTLITREDQ